MPSEVRQKNMEKLNRAQKCSILGPKNLGSRAPPSGSAPGHLPEHWFPFPLNPALHWQIKPPPEFTHVASSAQLCALAEHSFISLHPLVPTPSPLYPTKAK